MPIPLIGVHGKVPRLELFGTNSGKIWQGIPEISERILGILGLDQGCRGLGGSLDLGLGRRGGSGSGDIFLVSYRSSRSAGNM